jgi:hypothetical protein
MDNEISKEAKEIALHLLNITPEARIPALKLYPKHATIKQEFSVPFFLNYLSVYYLKEKEVIKIINIIKKGLNHNDYVYKISFRRDKAIEFLYIIHLGNFIWDKRDGLWTYKDRSHRFKPDSGQYRLIDMFMENPNKYFSEREIIETYITDRKDAPKRVINDLIKEIKKPLKIPKEHFLPGDGYAFKPVI